MRLAHLLDGGREILALERDGAFYSVEGLEARFGVPRAQEGLGDRGRFFTRVFAMGCAGLERLDDRLLAGDRPTEARVAAQGAIVLAPTAARPAIVCFDAARSSRPAYVRVDGRALRGDGAVVPMPPGEDRPSIEPGIAAIVGEELADATADEAARAIVGYAVYAGWMARGTERALREAGLPVGEAHDVPKQLGPVLVTRDEIVDAGALAMRVRVGGVERASARGAMRRTMAELVAYASSVVPLAPGDVVAAAPLAATGDAPLAIGDAVEIDVERLGTLRGRVGRPREAARFQRSES